MRWQYRYTPSDGKSGIHVRADRLRDPLNHFREVFGLTRISLVEERWGAGEWLLSDLGIPSNDIALEIAKPRDCISGAS